MVGVDNLLGIVKEYNEGQQCNRRNNSRKRAKYITVYLSMWVELDFSGLEEIRFFFMLLKLR